MVAKCAAFTRILAGRNDATEKCSATRQSRVE